MNHLHAAVDVFRLDPQEDHKMILIAPEVLAELGRTADEISDMDLAELVELCAEKGISLDVKVRERNALMIRVEPAA